MYDLLALALKCDVTRVATFMLANEGGGGHSYRFLGINEDYHDDLSHNDNSGYATKIATIDKWRVDQFAYFVGQLYNTSEGGGRLLDNMIIVYGSGVQYYSHSHDNLPIAVVGKGSGIAGNRHITANVPLCNLHLSVLNRMGVASAAFGNSNGTVAL